MLPQIKEYERVCTTVVNAYVGPGARALPRAPRRAAPRGRATPAPVLIIQSHGGVAPIAESVRLAAGAVLSGPAGGVAGSRYAARLLGEGNLITFDMGGTSTDIALVEGGEPPAHRRPRRWPASKVALPSLDIAHASAPAAARSRAWTPAASCTSGRRARAPIPGPPATAGAARPPR